MANGGGNTAGELNIKFTAEGAETVKAKAAEIKQSLKSVGGAGKESGDGVAEGAAKASAGLGEQMKHINHVIHGLSKMLLPVAAIHYILEMKAAIEETSAEAAKLAEELNDVATKAGKTVIDIKLSPEEREKAKLEEDRKAAAAKINETYDKERDTHKGILGTIKEIWIGSKTLQTIEDERYASLNANNIAYDKQVSTLNKVRDAEESNTSAKERFARKHAELVIADKLAAEDALKSYELHNDKVGAINERFEQQKRELLEIKRLHGDNEYLVTQIDASIKLNSLMQEHAVAAEKLKEQKEKEVEAQKEAAEIEKMNTEYARQRLEYNQEIEQSLTRQVGSFNLANASFGSGAAASAGAFGQQWSIASRVGR